MFGFELNKGFKFKHNITCYWSVNYEKTGVGQIKTGPRFYFKGKNFLTKFIQISAVLAFHELVGFD